MKVEYIDSTIQALNGGWAGIIMINGYGIYVYKSYDGNRTEGFRLESEARLAARQLAEMFPDRVVEELERTGYMYSSNTGTKIVRPGAFIALGR